ncbi:MAG: hypothetical protein AB7U79_01110 [Candidatus Izemoplasmatales bacterium]
MKTLRNKVILSAVVLAFALIATIGSTYAWFTVSQTATVESMTLNVTAANSLLVRVYDGEDPVANEVDLKTATNYTTTITNAVITASSLYTNLATYKLQPVTAIQDGYDSLDAGTLGYLADLTDYTHTITALSNDVLDGAFNSSTGYFVELKFWVLQQTGVNQNLLLNTLSVQAADQDGTREDIINTVRLSAGTASASLIYAQGGTAALANDYGFAFVAGLPGYTAAPGAGEFNSIAAGDLTTITTNALDASSAGVTGATVADGASVIATLTNNTPTLITVRIYVEGWDAQTTNDVIQAQFNIAWSFIIDAAV